MWLNNGVSGLEIPRAQDPVIYIRVVDPGEGNPEPNPTLEKNLDRTVKKTQIRTDLRKVTRIRPNEIHFEFFLARNFMIKIVSNNFHWFFPG